MLMKHVSAFGTVSMKQDVLCEVSQSALIRCSGADAQKFLQAQLTNDVAKVTTEMSQYTGYCTAKGRLLASFLLWQCEDAYYLQLPSSIVDSVIERLRKFVLRAKVELANVRDEWRSFGLGGDNANPLLQELFPSVPGMPHEVAHSENASLLYLPGNRFQIVAKSKYAPMLWDALRKNIQPADARVWDWLDIRAGIPVILPQTQEQFVPQMVNFDLIGGVSFNKGCYPGQEIVARTKYRGQIKRRMFLANIESNNAPQPGDELYSSAIGDQAAGMIVNAAPSPEGGYDALAVVQTGSIGAGVHLRSPAGEKLRFLPLPYAVGET